MEIGDWGIEGLWHRVGGQRLLSVVGWGLLVFVVPSLFVVGRLLGVWGLGLYVVVAPMVYWAWWRYGLRWVAGLPRWATVVLVVLTFVGLLLMFARFYPVLDSGTIAGGSDRDDALNVAVGRLLEGQYPYYARTYLENPISPLPGAVLLATPFVLLGNSAYQNFFWLALYFVLVARYAGGPAAVLWRGWAVLGLAPVVLQQLFNGGDLVANALYLVVFCWLVCDWRLPFWQRVGAAGLLGVGLSSRVSFWPLLVPLVAYLWRAEGMRRAAGLLGVAGTALLLVTLPFYLYDPAGFSPLHTLNRLARFGIEPPLTWLIPVVAVLLTLLLVYRRPPDALSSFWWQATVVLALPVVLGMGVALWQHGLAGLVMAGYGVGWVFFGLLQNSILQL